jgi:hypothetical protein
VVAYQHAVLAAHGHFSLIHVMNNNNIINNQVCWICWGVQSNQAVLVGGNKNHCNISLTNTTKSMPDNPTHIVVTLLKEAMTSQTEKVNGYSKRIFITLQPF